MEDIDKGMKKILEEMKKLGETYVKVGFPEGSGTVNVGKKEVDIAQIAYWNENGVTSTNNVLKKGKVWVLPPRPFMSQAVESNKSRIDQLGETLVRKVADGKIDAEAAAQTLASFGVGIVRKSIADGNFAANSLITIYGTEIMSKERIEVTSRNGKKYKKTIVHRFIEGKGEGKKPLTDEGTMKKAVNAVIVRNGKVIDRIKD